MVGVVDETPEKLPRLFVSALRPYVEKERLPLTAMKDSGK